MLIPIDNWQFWVVTLFACWACYTVVRPFIPRRGKKQGDAPACPRCASGSAARKKPKKTHLTVDGHK